MSLLEIAVVPDRAVPVAQILRKIESDPAFKIIPFSPDIAMEVAALGSSPPPASTDCGLLRQIRE